MHSTNEYWLPGAYRRLLCQPTGWKHSTVSYTKYTELLQPLDDVDKHGLLAAHERPERDGVSIVRPEERRTHTSAKRHKADDGESIKIETETETEAEAPIDEGERKGIVCTFCLPPGTYATMLFRELQKDGRPPRKRLEQHVRFD